MKISKILVMVAMLWMALIQTNSAQAAFPLIQALPEVKNIPSNASLNGAVKTMYDAVMRKIKALQATNPMTADVKHSIADYAQQARDYITQKKRQLPENFSQSTYNSWGWDSLGLKLNDIYKQYK